MYLLTYTREDLKERVTQIAEDASVEDVCMISYLPFEGNKKLIELLESTFGQ